MILKWRDFTINLDSFKDFLDANIPDADGIVASPDNFEIIEVNPLTDDEIKQIQTYYDSLTADGEAQKAPVELDIDPKLSRQVQLSTLLNGLKQITPDQGIPQDKIDDCAQKIKAYLSATDVVTAAVADQATLSLER